MAFTEIDLRMELEDMRLKLRKQRLLNEISIMKKKIKIATFINVSKKFNEFLSYTTEDKLDITLTKAVMELSKNFAHKSNNTITYNVDSYNTASLIKDNIELLVKLIALTQMPLTFQNDLDKFLKEIMARIKDLNEREMELIKNMTDLRCILHNLKPNICNKVTNDSNSIVDFKQVICSTPQVTKN